MFTCLPGKILHHWLRTMNNTSKGLSPVNNAAATQKGLNIQYTGSNLAS